MKDLTEAQTVKLSNLRTLVGRRREIDRLYEEQLEELVEMGVSQSEIARWIGVSPNAVRQYLMRRKTA